MITIEISDSSDVVEKVKKKDSNWILHSSKIVKGRKLKKCSLCKSEIQIGENSVTYNYINSSGSYTNYMTKHVCLKCNVDYEIDYKHNPENIK